MWTASQVWEHQSLKSSASTTFLSIARCGRLSLFTSKYFISWIKPEHMDSMCQDSFVNVIGLKKRNREPELCS